MFFFWFLTKSYKIIFFLSLNGKSSQKATKTVLAVWSMPIKFLQEVICVISGFDAYKLVPKLLYHHPDTK